MTLRHRANNVRPTDDANELAVLHNRNSFDFALGEEQGNFADRSLFIDRDDLMAHNV